MRPGAAGRGSRACRHDRVYVSGNPKICAACMRPVDPQELQQNYQRQGAFYVSRLARQAQKVRLARELIPTGRYLLFLDIDETILSASEAGAPARSGGRRGDAPGGESSPLPFSQAEKVINDIRRDTQAAPDPNGAFLERYYAYLAGNPVEYELPGVGISVSFRPGLFPFLLSTRRLAVVYVSTVGTKAYADAVMALLDPLRMMVKRVFSREDNAQRSAGEMEEMEEARVASGVSVEASADGSGDVGGARRSAGGVLASASTQQSHSHSQSHSPFRSLPPTTQSPRPASADDALMYLPTGVDSSASGGLAIECEEERLHAKGVLRFLGGDPELVKRTVIFDNSSIPWSGSAATRGFIPSLDYYSPRAVRERPSDWGWLRGALSPLSELLAAGRAWYRGSEYKSKAYFLALFGRPGKKASDVRRAVMTCLAAEQLESLRRVLREARARRVKDLQEHVDGIKRGLFRGCVFLIPSIRPEDVACYEEGDATRRYIEQVGRRFTPSRAAGGLGPQGVQEMSMVDLRVLTIRQFGGRVVASYGGDVTHVMVVPGDREAYRPFVEGAAAEAAAHAVSAEGDDDDRLLCRLCFFLRYGEATGATEAAGATKTAEATETTGPSLTAPLAASSPGGDRQTATGCVVARAAELRANRRFLTALSALEAERGISPATGMSGSGGEAPLGLPTKRLPDLGAGEGYAGGDAGTEQAATTPEGTHPGTAPEALLQPSATLLPSPHPLPLQPTPPDELDRLRSCYRSNPPDMAPARPCPGRPLLVTPDWLIDSVLMLALQPRVRAEQEALALLSSRLFGGAEI